ncbi:universal stress protein [Calothrix sp. NIES-3974]|uniref:universal stress protein n=1 Tax=Calothrix sp. NIES-3974 TaxID=2005462 RepID=UPI000B5F81C0|nr:universal stress protein [Calothrix sp. NIES-3974]BAZ07170.1 UspA domain-containing protein [Calothrix sp. NIES-3974]
MFKTVLFPIDQSRATLEAAELVINLVKTHQSQLTLLSVVESATDQANTSASDPMQSEVAVAQLLEKVKSLFAVQGIATQTIERDGKPAFIICDVADEINADLIVMGCRGLGLTEEGANDSVTNRVINLSPCPVLVVP